MTIVTRLSRNAVSGTLLVVGMSLFVGGIILLYSTGTPDEAPVWSTSLVAGGMMSMGVSELISSRRFLGERIAAILMLGAVLIALNLGAWP